MLSCFSCVRLFANLWTVTHQAPLSMGFSRQEYWSGLPCPPPGALPNPGIELVSLLSPALADGFFTTRTTWEALVLWKTPIWKESLILFLIGLFSFFSFLRPQSVLHLYCSMGTLSSCGRSLPCRRCLLPWTWAPGCAGFGSSGGHGLSYSGHVGSLFLDQGSNPCPLQWQVDS